MQSPYWTQTGQLQGGSHSGQGGGHGNHGPTRLHQQSPNITTRNQHLQSAPQGPHLPPQKQTHYPSQKTLNKQEAYPHKNTNNSIPPVQSHPSSMASLKSIKQAPLSDPLFPVGGQSHMGCQGAFPHHQTPGRPVPHTTSKTPNTLSSSSKAKGWNQGKPSPPLMPRLSLLLSQFNLPSK